MAARLAAANDLKAMVLAASQALRKFDRIDALSEDTDGSVCSNSLLSRGTYDTTATVYTDKSDRTTMVVFLFRTTHEMQGYIRYTRFVSRGVTKNVKS